MNITQQPSLEQQYFFPNESPMLEFHKVSLNVSPYTIEVFVDYFNHSPGYPKPFTKQFTIKKKTQAESSQEFQGNRKRSLKRLCISPLFDHALFKKEEAFLSKKFWEVNIRWLGMESYQKNAVQAADFIRENYAKIDCAEYRRFQREKDAKVMEEKAQEFRQFVLQNNGDSSHAVEPESIEGPKLKFKSQVLLHQPKTEVSKKVFELNDTVLASSRRVKKEKLKQEQPELYPLIQTLYGNQKRYTPASQKPPSKQYYRKPTKVILRPPITVSKRQISNGFKAKTK